MLHSVSSFPDNLTRARLVLVKAVQAVIAGGLAVMGCTPLEEMRNEQPNA